MPRPLSIAVIGAGNVARTYHVPCVTAAGAAIRYVVDPDPAARGTLGAAGGATALDDLAGLPDDVDCAIVSSPPVLHAAHVRALAERGIHVLCEKPLACTRKDAEALVELARARGIVLQAGYYRRFHPAAQRVRELLRTGPLGAPLRCTVLAGHVLHPREASASLMDVRQTGGGVLMDVGVHLLDRLLSWFDEVRLAAYLDDHEGGMEANALVRLDGRVDDRRVPITMMLSRTADLGYQIAVDFAEATLVSALNVGHELTVVAPAFGGLGEGRRPRVTIEAGEPRPAAAYFADQWVEFVAQIDGAPTRLSCLRDAVRTTALVEACYETRGRLTLAWEACARP